MKKTPNAQRRTPIIGWRVNEEESPYVAKAETLNAQHPTSNGQGQRGPPFDLEDRFARIHRSIGETRRGATDFPNWKPRCRSVVAMRYVAICESWRASSGRISQRLHSQAGHLLQRVEGSHAFILSRDVSCSRYNKL